MKIPSITTNKEIRAWLVSFMMLFALIFIIDPSSSIILSTSDFVENTSVLFYSTSDLEEDCVLVDQDCLIKKDIFYRLG